MQTILCNQGIIKSRLLSKTNISNFDTLKKYINPQLEKGYITIKLQHNKKKSFYREHYYLTENGIREYKSLISLF